ncbi:hypothetical protein BDZ97DRAFT_1922315 [Flammula alnicola]|nr:hypothetical protein BDZ97DRAFT_1922315 [Flammula alnicola]
MAPTETLPILPLPQEIINLIVDEVAVDSKTDKDSLDALRACSLVSRSFHCHSRRHLFSHIEFLGNKSGQKRAGRLVKILENRANTDLVAGIRSLTLVLDMNSNWPPAMLHPDRLYSRSRKLYLRVTSKLGRREDNLLKLLDILSRASLEIFALEAQGGSLDWISVNARAKAIFLAIRSNPSLNSLRLSSIINLDPVLVAGEAPSNNLRELTLSNVGPLSASGLPSRILPPSSNNLAGIERLDLLNTPHSYIFPLPSPPSASPSHYLPRLKSLVIDFPLSDVVLDGLWKFILQFSPTLESLDIREISWSRLLTFDYISTSIAFSQLPALRHVRLNEKHGSAPRHSLYTMIALLFSPVPRREFEPVRIELVIAVELCETEFIQHLPPIEWRVLDKILTHPMHSVHLRMVFLDITVLPRPTADDGSHIMVTPHHARNFLPGVATSPSIQFDVNIQAAAPD